MVKQCYKYLCRTNLKSTLYFATLMFLVVSLSVAGCTRKVTPIEVGFAQQEIGTIGRIKPGFSFHDSLYAKVIWVEDHQQPFGIVTVDAIDLKDPQVAAIKKSISDSLGIPEVKVIVCMSHTHSGTYYKKEILAARIGSIARKARQSVRAALVGYSRVDAGEGFVVNRRIHINDSFGDLTMVFTRNNRLVDDGTKMDVRGQVVDFILHGAQIYGSDYADAGVADTVDPAEASDASRALLKSLPSEMILDGPVDPHLEALWFRDLSGQTIGTLLRYSCHPTIFRGSRSNQYSADYPGILSAEVSKATGGAPVHFMQGPCGNIKSMTVDFGEDALVDFGTRLAGLITEDLKKVEFSALTTTFCKQTGHQFACRQDIDGITDEIRVKSEEAFTLMASAPFDPVELKKIHDWSVVTWASQYMHIQDSVMLPFSVLGFNQTALVTMPGEVFSQHGMNVKKRFPGKKIVVVELADCETPAYVPTCEAFTFGGYEVGNSALLADAGDRMVEICCNLLKEFYE